jgi:imidazolonepropionase-like amidohydrolase
MLRHVPLTELPGVVADLGYEHIELSPREDFLPFFLHPRADRAGIASFKKALAAAGTVAVLLPGTSFLLGTGRSAPAAVLREAGVTLALGTDCNPGTCYCESMQLIVALACVHGGLSPEEALLAATDGAARAVGRAGRAGRLGPGSACDLVVLEGRSYLDLAYHLGVNLARVVVKAGAVIARSGVDHGILATEVEGSLPHGPGP